MSNTEPIGNTTLVEHGILNEQSDLRAHVSVTAGTVYVFPTRAAAAWIEGLDSTRRKSLTASAYTKGIETARGYIVPITDIPRLIPVGARRLIEREQFRPNMSTSEKGDRAVRVVQSLLRIGWFPLPTDSTFVHDIEVQQKGMDLIVRGQHRIEVKCDYRGGTPGTGNLYLQFAECNPWKQF